MKSQNNYNLENLKDYQIRQLNELLNQFEENNSIKLNSILEEYKNCPHCNSNNIVKNGQSKNIKRFKCKNCFKTFSLTTNTVLHSCKLKDKWTDFVHLMLEAKFPYSSKEISEKLEVNYKTAFLWRHKFCTSLNQILPLFTGSNVEMDEVNERFNVKGISSKDKDYEMIYTERKYIKEKYQAKFLCVHNRNSDFDFLPIKLFKKGNVSEKDIENTLNLIDTSNIVNVISDESKALKPYFKNRPEINHLQFKASDIKEGKIKDDIHANNINSVRSSFKEWKLTFRGFSTKYIWNYLKWFRFCKVFQNNNDLKRIIIESLCDKSTFKRFKHIPQYYYDFVMGVIPIFV